MKHQVALMVLEYVGIFLVFCSAATSTTTLIASLLQAFQVRKTTWARDHLRTLALTCGATWAGMALVYLITSFLVHGTAATTIPELGITLSTTQSFLIVPLVAYGLGTILTWLLHLLCIKAFHKPTFGQ